MMFAFAVGSKPGETMRTISAVYPNRQQKFRQQVREYLDETTPANPSPSDPFLDLEPNCYLGIGIRKNAR